MFFTLSGYLIGKGFVSKRHSITFSGYQKYVNNRVLRIWPIYFFALLIAFVFIKPSSLNLASLSNLSSMLATVSFDQKNDGVIGALWSVSTEFQFYLIAPGLYLLVERFSPRGGWLKYLVICLTLCGGMLRFIQLQNDPASWHSMVYYPLLGNLDLFLVGMFAAIFVNMKKQSGIKNGRLLFQLGLIVLIFSQVIFSSWSIPEMISFEGFPGSPTRPYFLAFAPSITSLLTAVVIALFELGKSEVKMVDGFWKTSSRIGILTYCVYVFHEPIYMGLRTIWIGNPSPVEALRFFPVGIGLVYLVSLIMYRYIEIPFDRQRK
jgi:peptidoglycan/LPS O-acetylase OafA/YrhL